MRIGAPGRFLATEIHLGIVGKNNTFYIVILLEVLLLLQYKNMVKCKILKNVAAFT